MVRDVSLTANSSFLMTRSIPSDSSDDESENPTISSINGPGLLLPKFVLPEIPRSPISKMPAPVLRNKVKSILLNNIKNQFVETGKKLNGDLACSAEATADLDNDSTFLHYINEVHQNNIDSVACSPISTLKKEQHESFGAICYSQLAASNNQISYPRLLANESPELTRLDEEVQEIIDECPTEFKIQINDQSLVEPADISTESISDTNIRTSKKWEISSKNREIQKEDILFSSEIPISGNVLEIVKVIPEIKYPDLSLIVDKDSAQSTLLSTLNYSTLKVPQEDFKSAIPLKSRYRLESSSDVPLIAENDCDTPIFINPNSDASKYVSVDQTLKSIYRDPFRDTAEDPDETKIFFMSSKDFANHSQVPIQNLPVSVESQKVQFSPSAPLKSSLDNNAYAGLVVDLTSPPHKSFSFTEDGKPDFSKMFEIVPVPRCDEGLVDLSHLRKIVESVETSRKRLGPTVIIK